MVFGCVLFVWWVLSPRDVVSEQMMCPSMQYVVVILSLGMHCVNETFPWWCVIPMEVCHSWFMLVYDTFPWRCVIPGLFWSMIHSPGRVSFLVYDTFTWRCHSWSILVYDSFPWWCVIPGLYWSMIHSPGGVSFLVYIGL